MQEALSIKNLAGSGLKRDLLFYFYVAYTVLVNVNILIIVSLSLSLSLSLSNLKLPSQCDSTLRCW